MAERRLQLLREQIASKFPAIPLDPSLDKFRERSKGLDVDSLHSQYFGASVRDVDHFRSRFLSLSEYSQYAEIGIDKETLRANAFRRLGESFDYNVLNPEHDKKDPSTVITYLGVLQEYDQSHSTIYVVHATLYSDSIRLLGTEKHAQLVERASALADYGCCCMTEMGHGSNLSKLETTAEYDHSTREFIINSPTATAAKWWIGALARNANKAVVFARLIVSGEEKGIHVFVVDVRDRQHKPVSGVVIGDCGHKISMNGIDNGFILFQNYRVPYDSLLDKHAQINPQGKYKSSIKSNEKRFGIQITGFLRGRICSALAAEINLRAGLCIALRFSAVRKQFGSPERPILDYQLQKARLLPHLARMYAVRAAISDLIENYSTVREILKRNPEAIEVTEYHAKLSSYKGLSSWYAVRGLQDARESTGGHGYSAYSSLGRIRDNNDIHVTWEGENNVLMQQTSKFIMKNAQKMLQGKKVEAQSLHFLDLESWENIEFKFDSPEEVLEPNLLIKILETRCNYFTSSSMKKLQDNAMKSESIEDAWNNTQMFFLMDLSKSFGELSMARSLFKMAQNSVDANRKTVFNIFYLYCVNAILESSPDLVQFCLVPKQVNTLRDTVVTLMDEIGNHAISIVDAIAPPDPMHGSVLGNADGQVYRAIVNAVEREDTCYQDAYWISNIQSVMKTGKQYLEKQRGNNK